MVIHRAHKADANYYFSDEKEGLLKAQNELSE
jgi:hypothetical protein